MTNKDAILMPLSSQSIAHILMEKYGLSIRELADLLHVTTRTVYRILRGTEASQNLVADLIIVYCRLLHMQVQAPDEPDQKTDGE
jgi:plasmid maintenance system antidote protein VapI